MSKETYKSQKCKMKFSLILTFISQRVKSFDPQKRPMKETYEVHLALYLTESQKRPIKETYNVSKRPIKETYKMQKETYQRDI